MQIRKMGLSAVAVLMLTSLNGRCEAMGETTKLDARSWPAIGTIDDRFQSYNVEMAEVIGAKFWKPYAHMSASAKPAGPPALGIDPNLFEARAPVDLSNPRLRILAAALGPAYVRVSGSWANSVYFQNNDDAPLQTPPAGFRGVLTRAQWRGVVEFASSVNAKLVTSFAVGASVRDAQGVWTPAQARPLVEFTRAIGGEIYAAELFNEPNLASFGGGPAHYDASAFARDEAVFKTFVAEAAPNLKIVGPGDVVTGTQAMPGTPSAADLMTAEPRAHFDVFSYHYYGAVSQRCAPPNNPIGTTPEQALTEGWLARTDKPFQDHKSVRDQFAPNAPIWITETAGAACGGTPWDATFLDTFRYLDQMGRLAKQGVGAIFHNTLAASEYGLIDETTLQPRPNYWAAVLWRRLMGTTVLDTGPIRPGLHLHAHCLREQPGGVTVLAINTGNSAAHLALSSPSEIYALTAHALQSADVLLNGQKLAVGGNGQFPALLGQHHGSGHVTLAPTSITFVVLPHAGNPHCS